jgi:hypothetical protein
VDEGDAGGGTGCRWRPVPCGPSAHAINWGELWAYARVDLGLSASEFWRWTLYELDLLSVRHRRLQEREDRRSAMAAWVLANVNRDTTARTQPFSLEEVTTWLGYSGTYVRPAPEPAPEPATVDELKHRLDIVHMLHQGFYGPNGGGEPGHGSAVSSG